MYKGNNLVVTEPFAIVIGNNNKVYGPYSKIYGNNNTSTGPFSKTYGDNNTNTGHLSKTFGTAKQLPKNAKKAKKAKNSSVTVGNSSIAIAGAAINNSPAAYKIACNDLSRMIKEQFNNRPVINDFSGDGVSTMTFNNYPGSIIGNQVTPNRNNRKREREEEEEEQQYIEGPTPSELENDKVQDKKDGKTCVICLENVPCCTSIPCMHMIYCIKCSRDLCFGTDGTELKKQGELPCPVCKVEITAIKRVFQ